MAELGTATGAAKLKAVTDLVKLLSDDLEKVQLLPKDRDIALEELKIYGRDPRNADPIFTKEGISTLLRHAFYSPSMITSRAALRVLANAMLLKPETRQIFVDSGFASRACKELKTKNFDDEFLVSRILFLTTYGTTIDFKELIDKHQLAQCIIDNLSRHAEDRFTGSWAKVEPMQDMALIETLKLLFNLTHFLPDHISPFMPAIPHLLPLLWKQQDIPSEKPLDPPFGPLVNALLNLDLQSEKYKDNIYPKSDNNRIAARLIDILDPSLKIYHDNELESMVTPLVSIIRSIHEHAPDTTKEHIRGRLLPTAEDRENVLGEGTTLSARLLKTSTNPTTPALREVISHLLFEMSDRDASKFVENVGYGFASGFLFQNNVPVPASASEAFSKSDVAGAQKPVNPITGQFIEAEKYENLPDMTEEEKEREAERLYVTFERLKKLGIINVENPVETAIRNGQFRELKDDEVEELE
ncbi:guanine nucleotide exchange factor [Dactylonectria estremocensis]|uniref:Guanine nucleotide exchange factor n=1 Tax=Dactylonectria estremocensis TaxID=1079267 RepID=A0A9P9IUY3_9HYPO|nr:guanine nucleotide exchange factor [Dactylonectria estremocensis]